MLLSPKAPQIYWVRCSVTTAKPCPKACGGLGGLLGSILGGSTADSAQNPLGNGAAILGHILGGSQQKAEASLGRPRVWAAKALRNCCLCWRPS